MTHAPGRFVLLLTLAALLGGCCLFGQQRTGMPEGSTRDTPEQAFAYFQAAARLELYDLEFACFSPEFIEKYGGFTLDKYLIGRPLVGGETKDLLEALLTAEIVGEPTPVKAPDIDSARVVKLTLHSEAESYRGDVYLVRKPYYRLGLKGYDRPVEGHLEDLRQNVAIRDHDVLVRIPLTEEDWEWNIGLSDAKSSDITRVEVADRWLLLDIGAVFEVEKKDTLSEDRTP